MTDYPASLKAGHLTFDSQLTGEGFTLGTLTGWGPLGLVRNTTKRPNGRGSYKARGYPDERLVVATGKALANDDDGRMDWFENQFAGLFMDGLEHQIVINLRGRQSWAMAMASRAEQPDFDPVVPGSISTYRLPLLCSDPLKFGIKPNRFGPGTELILRHEGNYDASPVFEVTGNMSGYYINGPQGAFRVSLPVTPGHTHRIDMDSGDLFDNGVLIQGKTPVSITSVVPAGTDRLFTLNADSGAGQMRAIIYDTDI